MVGAYRATSTPMNGAPNSNGRLNSGGPYVGAPRSKAISTAHLGRLRRWLRRIRPVRKLKFTREGKYFVGITLGVGFAAINTGNNLLYLLLGMLLSLIVLSGVMSELSLRSLTVVRRLPPRAQVGRAHLVEIEVFNRKRRIPSYAIEVEDLRAGQPADKRCFFLKISPNSAQVAAYRRSPQRRGRDRHTGFRIATRFPFGLFEKSREVECEGELIIYPAVDEIRLRCDDGGRRAGLAATAQRGSGDDILGLRALRDGDDPRDIYWRKSTLDQPVVRERARDARPDIQLRLEVRRPSPAPDDWSTQFERRIRQVASRAIAHIKRGDGVTITTTAGARVHADRSVGADRLLRFLALLEPTDLPPGTSPPPSESVRSARPGGAPPPMGGGGPPWRGLAAGAAPRTPPQSTPVRPSTSLFASHSVPHPPGYPRPGAPHGDASRGAALVPGPEPAPAPSSLEPGPGITAVPSSLEPGADAAAVPSSLEPGSVVTCLPTSPEPASVAAAVPSSLEPCPVDAPLVAGEVELQHGGATAPHTVRFRLRQRPAGVLDRGACPGVPGPTRRNRIGV